MKDKNGLYYFPFPNNKKIRMYVKRLGGDICFRMWNQDDPEMWNAHGWVPYDAIRQASNMYAGKKFDPNDAYDIRLAEALLKDNPS